jgi:methanogenic corrinoid protein MtbC1
MKKDLISAFLNLDRESVLDEISGRLSTGSRAADLLEECRDAVEMIMETYERREIYMDGVQKASVIANEVRELLEPMISEKDQKYLGEYSPAP